MTTIEQAFVALAAVNASFCGYVIWRLLATQRHLADLLASRSYGEWAVGQKKLAEGEYLRKQAPVAEGQGYESVWGG